MKYIIRQKIWSIKDRFSIKDEFENDRFFVESKLLTIGNKLYLQDTYGNQLFYMEQKLFKIMPVYEIYSGDQLFAILKRKFSFLKPKVEIDQNGTSYLISGNALAHEFSITRGNTVVARVSKEWFAFSDTYGVEIVSGENEAFILSLVICIDQILHDDNH